MPGQAPRQKNRAGKFKPRIRILEPADGAFITIPGSPQIGPGSPQTGITFRGTASHPLYGDISDRIEWGTTPESHCPSGVCWTGPLVTDGLLYVGAGSPQTQYWIQQLHAQVRHPGVESGLPQGNRKVLASQSIILYVRNGAALP